MPHDIFISHSQVDAAIATKVCSSLEVRGVPCWIAPRNIRPTTDWRESIAFGIRDCRLMILILSSHSDSSAYVRQEIYYAIDNCKPILPFCIEEFNFSPAIRMGLGPIQWINAVLPSPDAHLEHLVDLVLDLFTSHNQEPGSSSTTQEVGNDVSTAAVDHNHAVVTDRQLSGLLRHNPHQNANTMVGMYSDLFSVSEKDTQISPNILHHLEAEYRSVLSYYQRRVYEITRQELIEHLRRVDVINEYIIKAYDLLLHDLAEQDLDRHEPELTADTID